MKLYHIDRFGFLYEGKKVELINEFKTEKMKGDTYFKEGLSSHGLHYFTNDAANKDFFLDAIFEYERMLNYPDKLSKFKHFIALIKKG